MRRLSEIAPRCPGIWVAEYKSAGYKPHAGSENGRRRGEVGWSKRAHGRRGDAAFIACMYDPRCWRSSLASRTGQQYRGSSTAFGAALRDGETENASGRMLRARVVERSAAGVVNTPAENRAGGGCVSAAPRRRASRAGQQCGGSSAACAVEVGATLRDGEPRKMLHARVVTAPVERGGGRAHGTLPAWCSGEGCASGPGQTAGLKGSSGGVCGAGRACGIDYRASCGG
ncbi:hypothetical protein B0H17DRAFT_1129885 [Mycena rosella]|uniref:Uncharacterized protein n=1 Tax=Mycena rosella TaxID=1033263 RepID=A0AAD7GP49_MYCRO|nr:hypothetical protein B0H17DRAFT_1129885 [Mycena rosella]